MSKTDREYHLIDLAVGISHGGFESLAGARQFARQEGLPAWDDAGSAAGGLRENAIGRPMAGLPALGPPIRAYWLSR
jgi:hypothetical protein